jgi:hypothetical protein
MKTFWHNQRSQVEIHQIAKRQEAKFGVSFACAPMRGGWAVRPCISNNTVESTDNLNAVLAALETSTFLSAKDFTHIAEETGLTLENVISVAKFINTGKNREADARLQKFTCLIDRSGKVIGMYKTK